MSRRLGSGRARGRPLEPKHVALEEDVRDKAVGFSKSEIAAVVGENPCGILTAMLEDGESVIEKLIHVRAVLANDSEDATHAFASFQPVRGRFLSLR